jgi:hypothetical protein
LSPVLDPKNCSNLASNSPAWLVYARGFVFIYTCCYIKDSSVSLATSTNGPLGGEGGHTRWSDRIFIKETKYQYSEHNTHINKIVKCTLVQRMWIRSAHFGPSGASNYQKYIVYIVWKMRTAI